MQATSKLLLTSAALGLATQLAAQTADYDLTKLPPSLQLAIKRADNLKFVGTRTVEFRRRGDTLKVVEYVTRDGNRVRIEFPEGSDFSGQVIVENSKERRHFLPATNEIRVLPPRRDESVSRVLRYLQRSNRPYQVEETGGDVIAGRRTREVAISDASGNVAERLFIDPSTGAVLKRQFYDRVGTRVGSVEFTKIDYRSRIDPELFAINRRGAKVISPIDDLKRQVGEHGFKLVYLKPESGAKLESTRVMTPMGRKTLMQIYSMRGARFSLFQVIGANDSDGQRRPGGDALKVTRWVAGERSYMFVGPEDSAVYERLLAALKKQTISND